MFALSLVDHLRLTFGHVIYSHKAHAQAAERQARLERWLKAAEILRLTAALSAVSLIFTRQPAWAIGAAAVELARALDTTGDPAIALRRYAAVRTKRTRAIAMWSRQNARIGSLDNVVTCWLRDTAIRLVPESLILRSLIALSRPPART